MKSLINTITVSLVILLSSQSLCARDTVPDTINSAYAQILGRTPSSTDLLYWRSEIYKPVPLSQIAGVFLGTREYLEKRISNAYLTLLGRPADASALNYWGGLLSDAKSNFYQANLIKALVSSSEYYEHNKKQNPNGDFVVALYRDLLGRAVGSGDYAYWTDRLNRGYESRESLAWAFLTSGEYANKIKSQYFAQFLHQLPTGDRDLFFTRLATDISKRDRELPAQIFAEFCNGGCAPTATIKADGVSGFYSVRVSGLNQSFRISAQCTGYDSWSITGSSGSLFNETTKFNGIQTIDIPTEWDINPHSGVYTYSITCKKLGAADATASVTVDYRRVFRLYVSQKEGLGTGKISCPGSGAECFSAGHCSVSEINLPEDAKFNCQALPDAGSRFAGWTACPGTSNNAYCSIVMNANQSVYARFEKASVP